MTSPAIDIASLLQPSFTAGVNLFVGELKEKGKGVTDRCIALVDIGSLEDNPKWLRDEVLIQILVRSSKENYQSGYEDCYLIKDILLGHDSVDINGSTYCAFNMQGGVNAISKDENNRYLFSMRFRITRDGYITATTNREDF